MENQIQLYHDATSLLLGQDLAVLKNLDKRLRERYEEGYQKGCQEAKARYCVTYFCSVCGGTVEVTSDKEKQAIRQYMRENGWVHVDCMR
jgi:hypothetical protein